ncbi:hypothetical protein IM40_02190 [Candidatus Paracaedimonas acanthamoebae]|nr:hypothetical protein IM40_02190 [Candidatus Paracaedimonas acanthamoebae]
MRQDIQRLKRKEEAEAAFINSALRKARTRTLVQAGGLLDKAGLLDEFSIVLGADLQKDIDCKDQVYALFGALLELRSLLKETEEYSHSYLALKGKVEFSNTSKISYRNKG